MWAIGGTHQHRLRTAVVVVHLREQQHDVGSPKRCRGPLSHFCISARKLNGRAEPARPTSSSLRLAAVAHPPVHLCNGDCPPLPRVARDITDSARCRSNVGLGGAITNEIDWPGQILKGHEAARNGPPSTRTTPAQDESRPHQRPTSSPWFLANVVPRLPNGGGWAEMRGRRTAEHEREQPRGAVPARSPTMHRSLQKH
jgi:hypothetical protein